MSVVAYYRWLYRMMSYVSVMIICVSLLILVFALTDFFGLSHFGYPSSSVAVVLLFVAIAYGVRRFARYALGLLPRN